MFSLWQRVFNITIQIQLQPLSFKLRIKAKNWKFLNNYPSSEQLQRMEEREYEVLSRLDHKHVCKLYLTWEESASAEQLKERDEKAFSLPLVCISLPVDFEETWFDCFNSLDTTTKVWYLSFFTNFYLTTMFNEKVI